MDEQTREALANRESWLKGAVLLLFYVLLLVATPLLIVVSLFGWIGLLIHGRVPSGIRDFGQDLARWYGQTTRYLTGNASRRPFPFEDLDCPRDEPGQTVGRASPVGNKGPDNDISASDSDTRTAGPDDPVAKGRSGAGREHHKPTASKQASGSAKAGKKTASKKAGKKKAARKKASGKKKSARKTVRKEVSGSPEGNASRNDDN